MHKNNIKAVLFDVIGTIVVETDPTIITVCFENAFLKHGVSIDTSLVQTNRGRDKKEVITSVVTQQKMSVEYIDRIYQSFQQNVQDNLQNFKARDEAEELFDYLQLQGVKIGLGTGLSRMLFEKIMNHLDWPLNRFDYVGFVEGNIRGRPFPDMIFEFMRKYSLQPDELLKVGDTVADIQEGKNAGVITAVILAGTQPHELFYAEQPDLIIKKLMELKPIFGKTFFSKM